MPARSTKPSATESPGTAADSGPVVEVPAQAEPATELRPLGEATDPAIQQLGAELQTARMNGDQDDIRDLVGELKRLGYRA